MTGPDTVRILREVPAVPARELQEPVVSLADDRDGGALWYRLDDKSLDVSDQLLVLSPQQAARCERVVHVAPGQRLLGAGENRERLASLFLPAECHERVRLLSQPCQALRPASHLCQPVV